MLTWARLLSVPRRRVNPSRTGDPHPWNAPFLINRREERCEDRLAYFLRRLSLDLVGIAARQRAYSREEDPKTAAAKTLHLQNQSTAETRREVRVFQASLRREPNSKRSIRWRRIPPTLISLAMNRRHVDEISRQV